MSDKRITRKLLDILDKGCSRSSGKYISGAFQIRIASFNDKFSLFEQNVLIEALICNDFSFVVLMSCFESICRLTFRNRIL